MRAALGPAAVMCLGLLACGAPVDSPVVCAAVERSDAALVGGTQRTEWLAMDPVQEDAVVLLERRDESDRVVGVCTAVLVAPTWVLSAAHCQAPKLTARWPEDAAQPALSIEVTAQRKHEQLDLLLLSLERAPQTSERRVRFVPVSLMEGHAPAEQALVQIAGTGLTPQGTTGTRSFAVSEVVRTDERTFEVDAGGRASACFGDSGGPALLRDEQGLVRVVGILSHGSKSCADRDTYVRTDAASSWLRATVGEVEKAAEVLADCSMLGQTGRCFGATVLRCTGGRPHAERCAEEQSCQSGVATQARCVPVASDECAGIDALGLCAGDEALRCVDGALQYEPCGACGASCVRSARNGVALCNADQVSAEP